MRVARDQPLTEFVYTLRDVLQPWSAPLRCALVVLLWFALVQLVGAAPAVNPVFRFYNQETGTHFYTIAAAERDRVIGSYPQFIYEGPAFAALPQAAAGALPVFRFYNTKTGTHFYTNSTTERDHVIATFPQFVVRGHGVLRDAGRGQRRPHRDSSASSTRRPARTSTRRRRRNATRCWRRCRSSPTRASRSTSTAPTIFPCRRW